MRCLITGADLYLGEGFDGGHGWHGDLHIEGDCYIFNAAINDKGEPYEVGVEPAGPRTLYLHKNAPEFFERRGVAIIPVASATLSTEAQAYVDKGRTA